MFRIQDAFRRLGANESELGATGLDLGRQNSWGSRRAQSLIRGCPGTGWPLVERVCLGAPPVPTRSTMSANRQWWRSTYNHVLTDGATALELRHGGQVGWGMHHAVQWRPMVEADTVEAIARELGVGCWNLAVDWPPSNRSCFSAPFKQPPNPTNTPESQSTVADPEQDHPQLEPLHRKER
ncbi:hypothetical protein CIB48_g10548 [Xylaria polymorpha]|nr:hypothetical protein CIB48_g10548 [Xylaria polymorpha]